MNRSRYRNYWYGIVLTAVKRYDDVKNENTMQSVILARAIDEALKSTKELNDGANRLQAIEMVYINGYKTIEGAAVDLNVSSSTIKRWLNSFINLVATESGFK